MSEANIKILKVKLIKGGEKLELGIKESGTVQANDYKECTNPVHPDLSKAVQALAVHLAILCDFIEPKQSSDTDEIEKFTVTGYSIGGKEGEEGVIITGMRKTKSGQKYSINSPFTRFDATEESRYILMNDLQSKLDTIEAEVREYLFNGKMQQPSLFNGNSEGNGDEKEKVTHMQVAEPLSDEEITFEKLKNERGGNIPYADPEAMKRVAEMDIEEKQDVNQVIDGAIGEMVEEQRNILRGRGKKKIK